MSGTGVGFRVFDVVSLGVWGSSLSFFGFQSAVCRFGTSIFMGSGKPDTINPTGFGFGFRLMVWGLWSAVWTQDVDEGF